MVMHDSPELPGAPHAQAIEKLAAVVELVVKPVATIAQTYAETHRIKKLTAAEIVADRLKRNAQMNAEVTMLRHQKNLEAIAARTKLVLKAGTMQKLLPARSGDSHSDPDWFHKWASYAKESSDHDIQALWAKVLAGEIVQPGRFSLRLLHTIHLMKKSEAQRFAILANYVCSDGTGRMFFLESHQASGWLGQKWGMDEFFFRSLDSIGLLIPLGSTRGTPPYLQQSRVTYGGRVYSLNRLNVGRDVAGHCSLNPRLLTEIGTELYELCEIIPDDEYAELLFVKILGKKRSYWTVTVEDRLATA